MRDQDRPRGGLLGRQRLRAGDGAAAQHGAANDLRSAEGRQRPDGDHGVWDNAPTAYAYAWQRCTTNNTLASCTDIAGADQATFTLGVADDGFWIRVTVTATNLGGATSQYSLPTVQVKRNRPDNTTRPVLTRQPAGRRDAHDNHRRLGQHAGVLHYAWKRCTSILLASCTTIDGATLSSYTPVPADSGLHIRAYVTATNSGGSATAYTYPTGKITSAT